jgi:hypothetical protein
MKTNAGLFFEDYCVGQVIDHAVPRTVGGGERALYHALYPARHALYSSDSFAQSCGLPQSPLDDLLLQGELALVQVGVQDDVHLVPAHLHLPSGPGRPHRARLYPASPRKKKTQGGLGPPFWLRGQDSNLRPTG